MPDDKQLSESSTEEQTETVDAAESQETETTDQPNQEESAPSDNESEAEPSAETEAASEPAKKQNDRAKPESAAEKRIKQLVARVKHLEQREKPSADPKLQEPKRPREDEFQTYAEFENAKDKYVSDVADYRARKAVHEDRIQRDQQRQAEERQQAETEMKDSWNERVETAKKRQPEFDGAAAFKAVDPNPATDGFLLDSDIGPDLLHYLHAHPEEASELREMAPYKVMRHLTKLEAQLTDEIQGRPAKTLPKPPAYVKGGSAPTKTRHLENILYGD